MRSYSEGVLATLCQLGGAMLGALWGERYVYIVADWCDFIYIWWWIIETLMEYDKSLSRCGGGREHA